jgi:hypothetical protein
MLSLIFQKILDGKKLSDGERAYFLTWAEQASVLAGETTQNTITPLQSAVTETVTNLVKGRNWIPSVSEVSPNLGLMMSGEFRTGNGKAPGDGFTGGRFGYPGFTYSGTEYFLAGVSNDVLQVGLSLSTGKIVAGAGGVAIDVNGIVFENTSGILRFKDSTGSISTGTAIYGSSNDHLSFVNYKATKGMHFGIKLTNTSQPYIRWYEDENNANRSLLQINADNAAPTEVAIGGSGGIYSAGIRLTANRSGGSTVFNETAYDVDTLFMDNGGNLILLIDAAEKRLEIGVDHYFPTRNASNPNGYWNEANQDMDFTFEGTTDESLLKTDAGLNAVGIGGAAESGYKLKVTGLTKVGGVRSNIFSIADDGVTSLTPASVSGGGIMIATDGTIAGTFFYSTAAPAMIANLVGSNLNMATGVLGGTTGTDGKFTVSAHTDGDLYFENRRGAASTFVLLLL